MTEPVRFHLSLNVADLDKSVVFFTALFGIGPAKRRPDYAKFEPDSPPLVLSLEPAAAVARSGPLNHVGLRMPDPAALVSMQERLERQGIVTRREEGVECCYAKQTKFWLHDPDGTLWEIYTLDGDIEHRGTGQSAEVVASPTGSCAGDGRRPSAVWEHLMHEPVPARIPHGDQTVDEVRLRGTLNAGMEATARRGLFAEARRVLRPGGRVFVHALVGETAVSMPGLAGPAAAVQAVPQEREPLEALEQAGFLDARLLKYDATPCFVRDGVAMREMQVEAFAPLPAAADEVEVVYRGPLRVLTDDDGQVYPRGCRVSMPVAMAERLRTAGLADFFTWFAKTDKRLEDRSCGSSTSEPIAISPRS